MIGIGFDSGGTHTAYAIDEGRGPYWPPGNESDQSLSNARSASSTAETVEWIERAIMTLPSDQHACAWIGAASYSGANSGDFFAAFAPMKRQLAAEGRSCEVFIANDGVSILKAPPLSGRGVAAIVGTGSVVMGTHPDFAGGLVKRRGYEWLVSDEGSGSWMTLACIRMLLEDIDRKGPRGYHSPLLDRLANYFQTDTPGIRQIPRDYLALARIDLIARGIAADRADHKRWIAGFVHPYLLDLAVQKPGNAFDPIAARVVDASAKIIADDIAYVSELLAAATADDPRARKSIALSIGGKIPTHEAYAKPLAAHIEQACTYVVPVHTQGDASGVYATLARQCLVASPQEKSRIVRDLDPLHTVTRLM